MKFVASRLIKQTSIEIKSESFQVGENVFTKAPLFFCSFIKYFQSDFGHETEREMFHDLFYTRSEHFIASLLKCYVPYLPGMISSDKYMCTVSLY